MSIYSPSLGTLSPLPSEIRTQIFSLVLSYSTCACSIYPLSFPNTPNPKHTGNWTSLLRVSRAIYAETKHLLVQFNKFLIYIERDIPVLEEGFVDGEGEGELEGWGWRWVVQVDRGACGGAEGGGVFSTGQRDEFLARGGLRWIRRVVVRVEDLFGCDLVGVGDGGSGTVGFTGEGGAHAGESSRFMDIFTVLLVELQECTLWELQVYLIFKEQSYEKVHVALDMVLKIRGVKKGSMIVEGSDEEGLYGFELSDEFREYVQSVWKLLKGVEAPVWGPRKSILGSDGGEVVDEDGSEDGDGKFRMWDHRGQDEEDELPEERQEGQDWPVDDFAVLAAQ